MKGELMFNAVSLIDEALIERANAVPPSPLKEKKHAVRKVGVLAAALAVVVVAVPIAIHLFGTGGGSHQVIPVPIWVVEQGGRPGNGTEIDWSTGVYTAEQIAGLFNDDVTDGVATNAYIEVTVPSLNELKYYCEPIPSNKQVNLYQVKTPSYPISEEGAWEVFDRYYDRVCEAFGEEKVENRRKSNAVIRCDYDGPSKKFESYYAGSIDYSVERILHYFVSFWQSESFERFCFHYYYRYSSETSVNGMKISVDQTEDDETIIASLEPVREALCELFEVDLPDVQIIRKYDAYSPNGCVILDVYFYNAKKNGASFSLKKCSDYIQLHFDNSKNTSDDIVSDKELTIVSPYYYHFRGTPEEYCELKDTVDMISLEEAEELLCKGYCFGGHTCPLCMAAQDRIDFEDYDEVGFLYYEGYPFYAFFKKTTWQCKNGNTMYARTLVPAIKVTGYEEYFEAQIANHPK